MTTQFREVASTSPGTPAPEVDLGPARVQHEISYIGIAHDQAERAQEWQRACSAIAAEMHAQHDRKRKTTWHNCNQAPCMYARDIMGKAARL